MTTESLVLYPDKGLHELLPRYLRKTDKVVYPLTRRASIKDIIEALHIPHTEIGSIVLNNTEVSFQHIPKAGERIFLCSFLPGTILTRPSLLRPIPLRKIAFMVDINAGKLARLLRMSGIDTWYEPELDEAALARQAATHNRILLSRNRDLLRRKIITWGHLVRAGRPEEQLAEVILFFGLQKSIKPFSRCLECNTLLQPVDKSTIHHRLEPLTNKYYQKFHLCPDCDQIFWQGSHRQHMDEIIQRTLSRTQDI